MGFSSNRSSATAKSVTPTTASASRSDVGHVQPRAVQICAGACTRDVALTQQGKINDPKDRLTLAQQSE